MPDTDPLPILVQAEGWLAIDKPAGLATVPARPTGNEGPIGPNVVDRLSRQLGTKVLPVHRLDQITCGVLVVATDPVLHSRLSGQFATRQVRKEYLARLALPLPQAEGTVTGWIAGGRKGSLRFYANEADIPETKRAEAKRAETAYERLGGSDSRWVLVRPHEGRRHQIRLALASIGCALEHDLPYYPLAKLRTSPELRHVYEVKRTDQVPALCAWRLWLPEYHEGRDPIESEQGRRLRAEIAS